MEYPTKTTARAAIEFSLQWQSAYGRHNDRWYADKIDFWRDFFPGSLRQNLSVLSPGEKYQESFSTGCLVPEYSGKKVIEFSKILFVQNQNKTSMTPQAGRFYPKSYAWKALHSFPDDMTPFRLVEVQGKNMVADTNHPLAKFPVVIEASMMECFKIATQRGGAANDIADLLTTNGPGMQIASTGMADFPYREYPFKRDREESDGIFYQSPRFVHHLDSTAREHVQSIYARFLSPDMRILDLMSSWQSHLPDSLQQCQVTGVGLNEEELKRNPRLSDFIVHDLNKNPRLPYNNQCFDAVICTVSIEYLVRPREVMAEIARIIRPGGIFIVITSDRWFPGKQILPWADLHPFERQGLVLQYFLHEKAFDKIYTESLRGYPRPAEDEHSDQMMLSDPLFVVCGTRRS